MASKRRKEKEEFFKDLQKLDEISSSDEDAKPKTKSNLRKTGKLKTSDETLPSSRRSKRPENSTTSVLQRAATTGQTAKDSQRTQTKTESTSRQAQPAVLRRVRSENVASMRVNKSRAKGKKGSFVEPVPENERLFPGLCFYFVPNREVSRLTKQRMDMATSHGATLVQAWTDPITHVIADSKWSLLQVRKELPDGCLPDGIPVITELWLIDCFIQKMVSDTSQYRFLLKGMSTPFNVEGDYSTSSKEPSRATVKTPPPTAQCNSQTTPVKTGPMPSEPHQRALDKEHAAFVSEELDELALLQQELRTSDVLLAEDLVNSDPSFQFEGNYISKEPVELGWNTTFQCMHKRERGHEESNPNFPVIKLFRQMAEIYDRRYGDNFRAMAFKKAATTLSLQKELIATVEQARKLPNFGKSTAPKVEEIVRKGKLGRLEEAESDPAYQARTLFTGIYQVGEPQASKWVQQGHRTLEDLVKNVELTPNQKVGIDHYEDFQTRIPRSEVVDHGNVVGRALKNIDPDLKMSIGGSYRRGSPTSGDIDVLITKEGADMASIRTAVMDNLLPQLKARGFVVAELTSGYDRDDSSKWMGACCLPEVGIWRRLDLLFVPWAELGAALIYWTGNDLFNRSLRLLASKRGWRLNQHGLYKDVLRGKGRAKLNEGELLESHSDEKIFQLLGVPYRPPEHRNA